MNPYDKEKTRQIWKRVLGEEEDAGCRAFDSETLRAMIASEKTEARLCMAIACHIKNGANVLQNLIREKRGDAKRLETVYYLWTGENSCAAAEPAPKFSCPADGIRQLHCGCTEAAARYRRAAKEWPEFGELFQGLAEKKERQGEQLRCLLQRYV